VSISLQIVEIEKKLNGEDFNSLNNKDLPETHFLILFHLVLLNLRLFNSYKF